MCTTEKTSRFDRYSAEKLRQEYYIAYRESQTSGSYAPIETLRLEQRIPFDLGPGFDSLAGQARAIQTEIDRRKRDEAYDRQGRVSIIAAVASAISAAIALVAVLGASFTAPSPPPQAQAPVTAPAPAPQVGP